jgi:hypothetical protein
LRQSEFASICTLAARGLFRIGHLDAKARGTLEDGPAQPARGEGIGSVVRSWGQTFRAGVAAAKGNFDPEQSFRHGTKAVYIAAQSIVRTPIQQDFPTTERSVWHSQFRQGLSRVISQHCRFRLPSYISGRLLLQLRTAHEAAKAEVAAVLMFSWTLLLK